MQIDLNDDEANALIQLLDLAVKSGGISASESAGYFFRMIHNAKAKEEADAAAAKEPTNAAA